MSPFLRFRRSGTCPSDLPCAVWCVILIERSLGWLLGRHNRPVMIALAAEKQAKLGFPTAAGDRRRLGVTAKAKACIADARQFRSGPVIIVVEVKRGLGVSCFVLC